MVQRYAHLAPEHLHQHAALLDTMQGTGYFDDVGTNLAQTGKEYTTTIHKKSAQSFDWAVFYFGAGTKSRTRDLLITSQLLYQLSYTGEEVRIMLIFIR